MTSTASEPKRGRSDAPAWLDHWFPVAFGVDVEPGRMERVTVHDRGYVLFRDAGGGMRCLVDRCPHRFARLSDGRLRDGNIECLYHGWRFDADGSCLAIPQHDPDQAVPAAACVPAVPVVERQGLVFIHCGGAAEADDRTIPFVDDLEQRDCRPVDFAIDLPYGQEYLVENVLDYAHIHIAHDGVRGGGHRQLAGPLAFELGESSPAGFEGRFGRSVDGELKLESELESARLAFRAPSLVHYRSVYPSEPGRSPRISGLALYCLPLGPNRCRLLYRAYSNFWPWRDRVRPRFWEHGYQCHLLEQDMAVVIGQAENIARTRGSIGREWLPLKTSDAPVLAFRKWLDDHAGGRPDYVGLRTRGERSHEVSDAPIGTRLSSHVSQCSSCRRALAITERVQNLAVSLAVILALVATCAATTWAIVSAATSLSCVGVFVAARRLRRRLTGQPPFDPDPI